MYNLAPPGVEPESLRDFLLKIGNNVKFSINWVKSFKNFRLILNSQLKLCEI